MKIVFRLTCLAAFFFFPSLVNGQREGFRLVCPLNNAEIVPPPKEAIRYDPPDLCIVITSTPDTVVKACIDGRVTNVEQNDEGGWDIVFFYKDRRQNKDYYFWYSGKIKPIVRRNDALKAGQAIGYIPPGERIEMLMFEFETQLDPTKFLDCKNVLMGQ